MSWRCRVRGPRSAFVADAAGRERRADRLRDRRVHRASARATSAKRRPSGPAYDVPFTTRARRRRSAAARRSTSCRATARSSSRSATCRSTIRRPSSRDVKRHADTFVPAMQAVDPAHVHRVRPAVDAAGLRRRRRQRDRRHRACVQRHRTASARFRTAPRRRCSTTRSMPAVICGPGHIEQAHQPNEWVSLEQLARCEAFMQRLAERTCASPERGRSPSAAPMTHRLPRRRSTSCFPTSRAGPPATPACPTSGASPRARAGRTSRCRR